MSVPFYRDYSKAEGDELARRAQSRSEHLGIDLSAATKEVLHEDHARRYSGANGPWALPEDLNVPPGVSEAYIDVANLLSSLRRGAGKLDPEIAAQAVNDVIGLGGVYLAAQAAIVRRKNQIVGNMSPGRTDTNLSAALSQTLLEMPATGAIYSAARRQPMTAAALTEMFPQFSFASRSSDGSHIYHDRRGEVRKYVYVVD